MELELWIASKQDNCDIQQYLSFGFDIQSQYFRELELQIANQQDTISSQQQQIAGFAGSD